jgi:hypothetical protein
VVVDNLASPPFPVMETSAELIYLLKYDKDNKFGFIDEFEQNECLQWLFFWHGSGAPYQGNLGFFRRAAEKLPCKLRAALSAICHSIILTHFLTTKLPLSDFVKKPLAFSAFWRSDSRASILASHVNIWPAKARGSIQLLILERGRG